MTADSFPHITVVVAAAGKSTRFQRGDKLLADCGGRSVFAACLENLQGPGVDFVVATDRRAALEGEVPPEAREKILWAPGGESRAESVAAAMEVLRRANRQPPWLAVHDAARPLAGRALLLACWTLLKEREADGVVPAHPLGDTIHLTDGKGALRSTPPRHLLLAAETPQLFRGPLLMEAYRRWEALPPSLRPLATDDASLLQAIFPESRVLFRENPSDNPKITYPHDF
ncbi:MAG: 2-C-methyl-D-erythritol 4-phosphate cytidylyltransferase [Oligosphaeraceae bacterium]